METAPYDVARFVEDLRNIVASRSDFSDIVADVDGFETNAFWDRSTTGRDPATPGWRSERTRRSGQGTC